MAAQQVILQALIAVRKLVDPGKIHRFVDQQIGSAGELDQILAVCRVARNHHRPARRVEAISECRLDGVVIDRRAGHCHPRILIHQPSRVSFAHVDQGQ